MRERGYYLTANASNLTLATDVFYVKPAANVPIAICGYKLANVGGVNDAGDGQEEDLRVQCLYVPATVTAPTGGGAVTPRPVLPGDIAAVTTARAFDTTTLATSTGTIYGTDDDGWNVRSPYVWPFDEAFRPICRSADAIVLRLANPPADGLAVSATLWFVELT